MLYFRLGIPSQVPGDRCGVNTLTSLNNWTTHGTMDSILYRCSIPAASTKDLLRRSQFEFQVWVCSPDRGVFFIKRLKLHTRTLTDFIFFLNINLIVIISVRDLRQYRQQSILEPIPCSYFLFPAFIRIKYLRSYLTQIRK